MTAEPPLPQTMTYQPPNSPALPVENAAGAAAPSGAALQQTQQQVSAFLLTKIAYSTSDY